MKQKLIDSFTRCLAKYAYRPEMEDMLGGTYRILEVNADGMVGLPSPDGSDDGIWWFPPVAAAVVVADPAEAVVVVEGPRADTASPPAVAEQTDTMLPLPGMVPEADSDDSPSPSSPPPPLALIGGLAIECWSIPGEEDVERMERVMACFVGALEGAQIPLPENIRRIQRCTAPQHQSCFVYNFGTRRMHVATRVTDAGRLLLVVRCGGGFIDFVEFARRHGSVEQLRLSKRPATGGGREVVRLTSVLAKGKVRARPPPSPPRSAARAA